jgi:hypothetical protein
LVDADLLSEQQPVQMEDILELKVTSKKKDYDNLEDVVL